VNHLLEASMALEQVTFELADHKEPPAFKEKRKAKFGRPERSRVRRARRPRAHAKLKGRT
jgi:hypothetical protein